MRLRGLLFDPRKSFDASRKTSVGVHPISAHSTDLDNPPHVKVFDDTAFRIRNPLPLKIEIAVLFNIHSPRPSYVSNSCPDEFSPVEHHYYGMRVAQ